MTKDMDDSSAGASMEEGSMSKNSMCRVWDSYFDSIHDHSEIQINMSVKSYAINCIVLVVTIMIYCGLNLIRCSNMQHKVNIGMINKYFFVIDRMIN